MNGAAEIDLELLEVIQDVLTRAALVAVVNGKVTVWSRGAEVLTGRLRVDVLGLDFERIAPTDAELSAPLDEQVVRVPRADGGVVEARRWTRAITGKASIHIEVWEPILPTAVGYVDHSQMLEYARDIARSRASERQKERQLQSTLEALREKSEALEQANAELQSRANELVVEVQSKAAELDDARAKLTQLSGKKAIGVVNFHGVVSGAPEMHAVFDLVRQIGPTDATVLIHGASGTGKELVARAVHTESPRANSDFVAVNCATLTPTLAESLLFGHKRGAFTGATADHDGVFVRAHGGTLFLDEIAELPMEVQSKLLRALQERTFTPVGAANSREVDVRIIAATHRDLRDEVEAGRFREDLMYRLRVVVLDIPSLNERRGDILELLRSFLLRHNERGKRRIESFSPSAVRMLLDYQWPGNVRELENALEYAFAVTRGRRVEEDDLPRDLRERVSRGLQNAPVAVAAPVVVQREDEASRIRAALLKCEGRVNDAAQLLGMSRATFHRKRKKHGID